MPDGPLTLDALFDAYNETAEATYSGLSAAGLLGVQGAILRALGDGCDAEAVAYAIWREERRGSGDSEENEDAIARMLYRSQPAVQERCRRLARAATLPLLGRLAVMRDALDAANDILTQTLAWVGDPCRGEYEREVIARGALERLTEDSDTLLADAAPAAERLLKEARLGRIQFALRCAPEGTVTSEMVAEYAAAEAALREGGA